MLMSHCPKWVTGELYIAGDGVAQGYIGDLEKTRQRFFEHPETGEKLYKTGDLGKYIEDGNIDLKYIIPQGVVKGPLST